MEVTREEARAIVEGKNPEYKVLVQYYLGQEKGVFQYKVVTEKLTTGEQYTSFFQSGYKPSIDAYIQPYERDEPVFHKVFDDWFVIEKFFDNLARLVHMYNKGKIKGPLGLPLDYLKHAEEFYKSLTPEDREALEAERLKRKEKLLRGNTGPNNSADSNSTDKRDL